MYIVQYLDIAGFAPGTNMVNLLLNVYTNLDVNGGRYLPDNSQL